MNQPVLIFLVALLAAGASRAEVVDRIAAVVNGEIILLSEAEEMAGPGLPPPGSDPARRQALLSRAVEELVADKLVTEVAKEQGLEPAPAEIDAAIENVKRENRIDDRALAAALAQQGLTMDGYREMLSKQLTRMKVAEVKVRPRLKVSEDDVRRRYQEMTKGLTTTEERRLRDVFVPADGDPAAARARVEEARRRVAAGEPFEKVARETGGPLADAGGDLGWVARGAILPALEEPAFALKKGQMSEVFEVENGFHLLYVEDVRARGAARSLPEAREDIRAQLTAERMAKATEDWLAELRRTADVDIRLQ